MLKIKTFIESKYFLLSISVITFLGWFFNIDSIGPRPGMDLIEIILISIFALVISFILINFKETIYTFPLIMHSIIMLSSLSLGVSTLNNLWMLYVVLFIVLLSFIYHFIKFKVKLKLGKLGLGLVFIALAYFLSLSGFFLDGKSFSLGVLFISSMGLIYLLIYVFYRSTNTIDYLPYILKSFYYLSFVVVLQTIVMLVFYFVDNQAIGSFIEILKKGIDNRWMYDKFGLVIRLSVGWGVGNNIGGLLAMLLPVHMYFLFKEANIKTKLVYFASMLLNIIIIVITTSRGAYLGVLAFLVMFLLAIIFYAKIDYKKYKKQLIVTAVILFLIAIPVVIYMFDFFISFLQTNSLLNGREEDWSDAIKYFLEYPIFGKSWYSDTWGIDKFRSYHNTILHTLATMGLFGLATLIYHHFELVRLFVKKWGFETLVVLSMLVVTHTHGLVDNTYYAPLHFFSLIILYIGIENKQAMNKS